MKKILIIEDDPAISLGLVEFLKAENFEVINSFDGKLGYEIALREKPELLLLDVNLPTMEGIQICRKLREQGFKNPIIMLTSKSETVDKIVGLEVGADDYITKPFDTRELLARIHTNLRRQETDKSDSESVSGNELQRHLLAIMFSDMKNYSRKMNKDEKFALELLQDHNEIMKFSIHKFHGKVVEIIGDAFLASFESALDCLNCCIYIQKKFNEYNLMKSKHQKIKVRIGVHVGDIIEFEGGLKGDALNIAARIQQIAEPGTIYASENFYLTVKGKTDTEFKKLGSFELKNIKDEIGIYVV